MDTLTVSRRAARRFLVRRSGLGRGAAEMRRWPVPGDTLAAVKALEYVQVDPMSVLSRSQDLVLGARVGGYRPEVLDDLLYGRRSLVEVVAFDRCIVPVEDFPLFLLRFREIERRDRPGLAALEPVMKDVLARVRADGPLSSLDFEDDRKVSGWWDADGEAKTKAVRQALEWLWHFGRLVISRREGLRRYFDLPERVLGEGVLAEADRLAGEAGAEREVLRAGLARKYVRAMGLSNARRFHFGFLKQSAAERQALVEKLLEAREVLPVAVEGSSATYYVPAVEAGDLQAAEKWEPAPEVRILGPLDNLIWDRERLVDLWGFDYTWEAYVPPAKRKYGPYTCPILWGDRLVGRVDARVARSRNRPSVLVVNGLWWEGVDRPPRSELVSALERLAGIAGAAEVADPNEALR